MTRRRARATRALLVGGAGIVLGSVVTTSTARADDPQLTACISANESSIQRLDAHKLFEARDLSQKCTTAPCPALLRDACKKRIERIDAAIPAIAFDTKDSSGVAVVVTRVSMDGQPLAQSPRDAVRADPGEHKFVFESEGRPPVEKLFTLREGEKDRREPIVFAPIPPLAAPAPLMPPAPPPVTASPSTWSTSKSLALVAGGAGLAGIAVGSVFGLMARSSWSSSQSDCPSATSCAQHAQAVTDHDSATSSATVSTIAFAAGGAALAAGAILWLTAPHAEAARTSTTSSLRVVPVAGPGGTAMLVTGSF
jgi:hypothetical protein